MQQSSNACLDRLAGFDSGANLRRVNKELASFDVPNLAGPRDAEIVRHCCVDCEALSPAVATTFTLISARFGWRLHREKSESGEHIYEWRCPECWESFRSRRQLSEAPQSGLRLR